jgi:hypothetical protein
MMNPQVSLLANQYESGRPMHTIWDVYAEQHNPIASANHPFVPDTQDAHGGSGFTNFSPELPIASPEQLIVWYYEQNYQGTAPLEVQPQLNLPNPWEVA